MNKIILKNGIFGGLTVCVGMIYISYTLINDPNVMPSMTFGFASMFVAFLFVLFGILQQRKANNDVISFGAAFKTGILITLITSTIYVLVWLVIYYNYFPDFIERMAEITKKITPPEELEKELENIEVYRNIYKTPQGIIGMTYFEILPMGTILTLIYSAIAAFIMKKK